MRLLSICLLFFTTVCLTSTVDATFKWGLLFKSFFNNGAPGIEIQPDNPQDDNTLHTRVKRAIYAALGWSPNCNPGWTGTYCETPICNPERPLTNSNTMSPQLVDRVDLGSGCSQTLTFPIASRVQSLTITVSVTSGSPKITLIDNNNMIIQTQGVIQPTASIFIVESPIPGSYFMNVTLDEPSTYYCRVHVEVMSYLKVDGGFVMSPHSDNFENSMMYSDTPYYFVSHAFNMSGSGSLGAFFVKVDNDVNPIYTSKLSSRFGCNYEYYAGYYTCQTGFYDYYWTVEGTDYYGYRFRRTKQFQCLIRPTPPTTIKPTTQPPTSCLNGGTMVNVNSTNQFCYCGEFYTGNDCAWPVCMNGGVQTPTGCDCQDGYTGSFCEHVTCSNDNIGNFFSEQKTLIIVIRRSNYILNRATDIARIINEQINYYLVNDVTVYTNFILVSFGNKNITWFEYYDKNDMINDMLALSPDATGCNDTVIDAVSKVFLASAINNKSPILVFTDVPANDQEDYLTINFMNTFRKLPIFVYYYSDPSNTCNIDVLSIGYRVLQGLAHTSGGLLFTPTTNLFINAVKYSMRSVTYHRQWVLGYDYFQCQMGNHGSFFVDSSTLSIAIMATGTNLSISVNDPLGNSPVVIDALPSDNNNFIWNVTNVVHGAYLFFITSSGGSTMPCNYRVYIESEYDLFYGVSNSLLTDAIFSEPMYNRGSNMVALFNGLRNRVSDQFRLFAEMQISRANASGHLEPVYYSNGIYRDGCNFHLYFGTFICRFPNEHLYMTVFADDERGYPIQRTAVAYCAYEEVTQAPPGTCLHGGVPNPSNTTSSCLCPALWTGRYCERIVCVNNGTAVNDQYCQCPPYNSGRHCEQVSCDNAATNVDFGFTHRSLAFVLNVHKSMSSALQDLSNKVQDMVRDLFIMHTRFITHFVVVIYNENSTQLIKRTDDPFGFISAIQAAAVIASNHTESSDCKGLMDSAILLAVEESLEYSYVFVFTDSESSEVVNFNAMQNAQDLRTQINLVATSNNLCGGVNGYQFTNDHINMVAYTEGELFYTTHPGNFLQYIPTLYKSGRFGGYGSQNCSIQSYLPVDYWAQSFTVYVGGQNIKIQVTPPAGQETDYLNIIDTDQYMTIQQYIIPCEKINNTIWQPSGQYCYRYVSNASTWDQAYDICHSTGRAHMIHIFNNEAQTYINSRIGTNSIWLGLRRNGNTSQFVWDTPPGAPPLILTGYTNWEPSQNQSDISTGNCVILKQGTDGQPRWWTADCSTTSQTTMCQRHKFDQAFIPGQDVNLLPAGIWKISITGTGNCGFSAAIQSEIQIFYKFTDNIHNDQGRSYANLGVRNNRIIATPTGLAPLNYNDYEDGIDGKLNYAYIYNNESLSKAATFQQRTICSYKSVSQPFACPSFGSSKVITQMPIVFTGIDQFGNLFDRLGTPYCSIHIAACLHGGVLLNGRCICPPNFEGEQCENRICFNGGSLMPNGECMCTEETTGESCQWFQCVPPRKVDFTDNGKTLVILLESSYSMATSIYRLRKNIASIVTNITQTANAPNWFTNYMLVPFDSTTNRQYWYNKTVSTDINDIVNAMNKIPLYDCPNSQCAPSDQCPRPILSVINDTLNDPNFVSPNSVILLFTQSSVEDITQYQSVFANLQKLKAQIQVIIPDITSPCSLPWTDPSNRALFSLSQLTGGDLFTVYSLDMVNSLLPLYLPSLYRGAVVDSLVVRNCSRDEILISLDSHTPEMTIVYSGVNPKLTLIDPFNQSMILPPNAVNSIFNYFGIVQTYNKGGIYKLIAQSDSSAGSCLINIHANSQVEVTVGYVIPNDPYNGATSDDANWVAVADPNKSNVVVFHTNDNEFAEITYVQLYSINNFGRGQIFTSEVYPRSFNCSYQWYSVRGFRCNSFETYELAVYGIDNHGLGFRRSQPVHCLPDYAIPQRPPTPPTCDISTRLYDIMLIIDGSSSTTFNSLKSLMATTFTGYKFDANTTRLGVIVVNGGAKIQSHLKDSDGKTASQILSSVTSDNSPGQNLQQALNLTMSEYNDETSGYRTATNVKHLIVYVTSNAQFTGGDPVNTLLSIRRSGMFGFISVGYNIDDSGIQALNTLTTRECSYTDSTKNAPVNIVNYVEDVTCIRRPICGE